MISRFTNKKMAFCAKFNPDDDKQHLIVAGTSANKIVCWDIRSGDIVQVPYRKDALFLKTCGVLLQVPQGNGFSFIL
jgi:hypothetical protein